ncbi:MAG: biopolymer transporter ExbD, partial [Leptolyngbyaceae cyanobacterium SM2_5_2]|nr:biopolymer transporter ExbD [Leptolyngbyaceae cyanobacterium SM2_5_2]
FCILTFFILAAVGLTRQQAIDLDLPAAQTGQPLPGQVGQGGISDRLYVSVDNLGQIYLDQQPVTLDLLYDVLLQFNQVNPTGLIVLYASRDARYEDVVTVLDVLRSVGGDRVALATLPRDLNLTTPGADPSTLPEALPQGSDFDPAAPIFPDQPSLPLDQPNDAELLQPGSQFPVAPDNFSEPNPGNAPAQP